MASSFPTSVDSFLTKIDKNDAGIDCVDSQITILTDGTHFPFSHDNIINPGWTVNSSSDGTGTDYTGSATYHTDTNLWRGYLTFSGNNGATAFMIYKSTGDQNECSDINNLQDAVVAIETEVLAHEADYAHHYFADSEASDDYVITPSPAISAYAAGQTFNFKANTANTGAATLNVNGKGAKTIKKNVSNDLETGDILANQIVTVIYDGTNFQLIPPNPILKSLLTAAGDIIYASAAGTPARLAKGTDGQVLVLSGGLPVWGVASLWEKIVYTVLASTATYVDFTDISTDYDLFWIIGINLLSLDTSAHELRMRFNSDTGANYDYYVSSAGVDAAYISFGASSLLASTGRGSQLDLLISNVSATKRKLCNGQWTAGSISPWTLNGRWNNTTDKITSIRLYPDANYLATGCEFVLLGARL